MKLNPNCIRAILLTIEDTCDFDTPWEYDADDANSGFLSMNTTKFCTISVKPKHLDLLTLFIITILAPVSLFEI